MTWSWSHTTEAYRDAEINLHALPLSTLQIIAAEWKAWDGDTFAPRFDSDKYSHAGVELATWSQEDLADFVWEKMSDEDTGRNCTDGGHFAHCCPFGCDPHLVAFDVEERIE